MKVLTVAQMREVDRRTVELGIPGIILMENAGQRVVEFLQSTFAPLSAERVVVLCGKGNNGGDGFVIARQIHTRALARSLDVVLLAAPDQLKGDAAANYRMLRACGCPIHESITAQMRGATLVIDALLGTGVTGSASGAMLHAIHEINQGFPAARVVAVDIPSGMSSDAGETPGETARADYTVTFTAPKIGQVLAPNCDRLGELIVVPIGSPPELIESGVTLLEPACFARLFTPRKPGANKGDFGHVLVIGGARGKTGAAIMAGLSALRAGAGLVTVACSSATLPVPELMTAQLDEPIAHIPAEVLERKTLLAAGPGLGTHPDTVELVRQLAAGSPAPMVIDADGLNALAPLRDRFNGVRVLTPHPGEMARLCDCQTAEVQQDRLGYARNFAVKHNAILVLKGQRTLIAFPDGRVWINPTGTPAMATGGTGDILTGLIAGMMAQFPGDIELAIAAAVWLHGRAGQLGAADVGEKSLIATDILRFLPRAIDEIPRQL